MTTEPTEVYCQHGHQMSPGDLLARYCHGCLWAEIARLTAGNATLQGRVGQLTEALDSAMLSVFELQSENNRLTAEVERLQALGEQSMIVMEAASRTIDAYKAVVDAARRVKMAWHQLGGDIGPEMEELVLKLRALDGGPCPACHGSGEKVVEGYDPRYADTVEAEYPCPTCGGTGRKP